MEIRKRSQKAVAKRHDLDYFKKGSPIRHWQWTLTLAAIAASVVWVIVASLSHGPQLFSKGPVSSSHAVFGAKCEACHVESTGTLSQTFNFRHPVTDAACQSCHQVPGHQPKLALASLSTPSCGTCHIEHTGSMMIAHAPDKGCTSCHADLKSSHYASKIRSFTDGHPQFAALRSNYEDDQKIKFNHQAHLQKGLKGPNGDVNLNCADCHRTPATQTLTPWRFGAPPQVRTATPDLNSAESIPTPDQNKTPAQSLHPTDSRAYMATTQYAQSCHNCHTLKIDKYVAEEAPHASPAQVQAFIREKLQVFAVQNPQVVAAEIENWPGETTPNPPHARLTPPPHNPEEWIAIRSRQAERRLWFQSCNLCHVMKIPDDPQTLAAMQRPTQNDALTIDPMTTKPDQPPAVVPTNQRSRWFTNAVFSHQPHTAVSCESCHSRARTSNQGTDILLPGIASCQKCHDGQSSPQGPALASGHAESGCFLCHQYHDWNHPETTPVVPHNLEFKEISKLQPQQ